MNQNAGAQNIVGNNNTAIQASGVAVRVFMVHIVSGGTPSVVSLKNGTASGSANFLTLTGTASTGATFNFGDKGIQFASGCFVVTDTNSSNVLVTYNTAS